MKCVIGIVLAAVLLGAALGAPFWEATIISVLHSIHATTK